jgi:fructan beta-fructosidase
MSMDIPESEYRKIPSPAPSHSRLMQYFVGTFDGYVFREENTAQSPLLVDYGPDFYAGTVFSNVKDPILIAWLGDFAGQRKVPTEKEGFCGILCYPRKLSLAKKGDLYLLRQEFFPPYQGNRTGRIIDRSVIEEISDDGLTAKTSFYS